MLWYVGSVYVIILLLILIAGLGIFGMKLFTVSVESVQGLMAGKKNPAGGDFKNRMSWLNYAALVFTGIIISYFALGLSAVNQADSSDHNHDSSAGIAQPANAPGNWAGGQGNAMDNELQNLNQQLNYMELNLRAMEKRHYSGY